MRIYQEMPAFEGVVAGNTALCKLPTGRRYHFLDLEYSNLTLAQMNEIRITANGRPFQRFTAGERDALNQYLSMEAAAGFLRIWFDRPFLRVKEGEALTGVNTHQKRDENGKRVDNFNVEVDIDGAAVDPSLKVHAEQSEGIPGMGPGTVPHIQRHTRSAAGAGEFQVSDLPYNTPTEQKLIRSTIVTPNDRVDKVEIERGLYSIFKRTKALNEWCQKNGGGDRVPQAGYFIIDSTERGYAGEPIDLEGFQDFRYKLGMSAAENLVFLQEYVGVLGG